MNKTMTTQYVKELIAELDQIAIRLQNQIDMEDFKKRLELELEEMLWYRTDEEME